MADSRTDETSPRFCDYEGSQYRRLFWEGQGREYEDLTERIALRKLLPPSGHRIIDIGGGFGRLVDLYSGYREIILMDYSMSQLQDARGRLGQDRVTYVAANLYQMPFAEGAFDAAVMVRVLHHQSDVPAALRCIHSILQAQATLVLEYANKRHLKAILRYALRQQDHNPFTQEPWEFVDLNFDFHPAYIERSLVQAGFSIERQLGTSHFRIDLLKRLVPMRVLATLDGWLQQPTAGLKLTPSIFLRARCTGKPDVTISQVLFRCPHCGASELMEQECAVRCGGCGSIWSKEGGIYDFRHPAT